MLALDILFVARVQKPRKWQEWQQRQCPKLHMLGDWPIGVQGAFLEQSNNEGIFKTCLQKFKKSKFSMFFQGPDSQQDDIGWWSNLASLMRKSKMAMGWPTGWIRPSIRLPEQSRNGALTPLSVHAIERSCHKALTPWSAQAIKRSRQGVLTPKSARSREKWSYSILSTRLDFVSSTRLRHHD